MSDDLDMRSGGVVAVDTDSLRSAANGFDRVAEDVQDVIRLVAVAAASLLALDGIADSARRGLEDLAVRAGRATTDARETATGLRTAAAVYEQAELAAEWGAARLAGDSVTMRALEEQRAALAAEWPDSTLAAMGEGLTHEFGWAGALLKDAAAFGTLGPGGFLLVGPGGVTALGALVGGILPGIGRMPGSARLGGAPTKVALEVERSRSTVSPPASIEALAKRMPSGEARVRVETYTMPSGQRQHVLYVAGTDMNRTTPWDNASNGQLAAGQRSASYDATVQALRDAGARPGDVVHALGHSQGAMITSHLALEGGYDTRTLISFGSPVDADVPESTLNIVLRHTDDPVPALAAGGHAQSVGAADSVIVERDASWVPGATLDSHHMSVYSETAAQMDASSDPRLDAMRELLDELGGAASVTAVEYSAQRVPTGRWDGVSPSSAVAG